jgi:hypothetical protein
MSSRKYVGPAIICRQYVGPKPAKICRPKKKFFGGAAPEPPRGGPAPLHPPLTPPRPALRHYYSCKEYNTYPTFSHLLFSLHTGVTGLHSQQSRAAMPMDPLHQENFSVLTDFVNESATFFKVSTFISDTFFSSIMSLTK